MATATETYTPRLKDLYEGEIRERLKDELGLDSIMQVPRIEKITLNMGVGEAKTDSKAMDAAIEELTTIAGQRAQVRKATKSIALSMAFASVFASPTPMFRVIFEMRGTCMMESSWSSPIRPGRMSSS